MISGGGAGVETCIYALVVASVDTGRGGDHFAPAHSWGFALGALPADPRRGTGGVTIRL